MTAQPAGSEEPQNVQYRRQRCPAHSAPHSEDSTPGDLDPFRIRRSGDADEMARRNADQPMIDGRASRPPALQLTAIGSARLEVTATGAFCSGHIDTIAQRLTRLTAARYSSVHIDCSDISFMDSDVAELFRTAATRLHRGGGELVLGNQSTAVGAHNFVTPPRGERSGSIADEERRGTSPVAPGERS